MLNPENFCTLEVKWGPHTIDKFANSMNAQLVQYNSRYWEPGTEVADTLTCSWADDNNWLCTPIYLIPRVLRHAKNSMAKGTLVVPK